MWCKVCGAEYQDGVRVCSTCEEQLIPNAPTSEEQAAAKREWNSRCKNEVQSRPAFSQERRQCPRCGSSRITERRRKCDPLDGGISGAWGLEVVGPHCQACGAEWKWPSPYWHGFVGLVLGPAMILFGLFMSCTAIWLWFPGNFASTSPDYGGLVFVTIVLIAPSLFLCYGGWHVSVRGWETAKLDEKVGRIITRIRPQPTVLEMEKRRNVRGLTKVLLHGDEKLRMDAAAALGRIGDLRCIERLCVSCAFGDRDEAVARLLVLMGARALEATCQLVVGGRDRSARLGATKALGHSPGGRSVLAALEIAVHEDSGAVPVAATESLGRIGTTEAIPILIRALDDSFYGVRLQSVISLGWIAEETGDTSMVPVLIQRVLDDRSEVRRQAVSVLGDIGVITEDKAIVAALLRALRDSDMNVREAAADSLELVGDTGIIEQLRLLQRVMESVKTLRLVRTPRLSDDEILELDWRRFNQETEARNFGVLPVEVGMRAWEVKALLGEPDGRVGIEDVMDEIRKGGGHVVGRPRPGSQTWAYDFDDGRWFIHFQDEKVESVTRESRPES